MKYALLLTLLTACASVPIQNERVFVVNLENARTHDAIDPRFFLVGSGRFQLGVVGDQEQRSILVRTTWLGADGCASIASGDWVSERFCWHEGEVVDVKVMDILSTSSAWSHR